jgi:type VI secretion system secreted protein Hcp
MSLSIKRVVSAAVVATALGTVVPAAAAAVDFFVNIAGVPGECQDTKHKNEIQADSWSWGASTSAPSQVRTVSSPLTPMAAIPRISVGEPGGKTTLDEFSITKKVDAASIQLFLLSTNGKHVAELTLTARKAGTTQQEFLKIKLKDVSVTSYRVGGAVTGEPFPTEQVSFAYAGAEYMYATQKLDGTLNPYVTVKWGK